MRAIPRNLIAILPALGLLAACAQSQPRPVAMTPPPPPPIDGALVAPHASAMAAYSGSSMPPAAAMNTAMRLSANDTLALLANNTAVGLTDVGAPYVIYFANNGVARFREGTLVDGGTWKVLPDGEVCSQLPRIGNGAESCYVLARYGDVILYQRTDGVAQGSIRVVAGNPQSL